MPVLQSREALAVDIEPEALQDCFVYDLAALIDRDFDDLIAGRSR